MISQDLITQLTNKYQTIEVNVSREYFQHLFLLYFYQQPKASTVYFKGGTALRIIYQSPRFSEDLDFNAAGLDTKTIEEIILDTIAQIQKEDVSVNIQESKETSGGYFATLEFEGKVAINLQISFRETETRGDIFTVLNDFIPPYTIVTLAVEQLIGEKMRALLDRKKPRDFYDLYFIIRDPRLRPYLPKERFREALEMFKNTDINFEFELKRFLPKSHWVVIRDFNRVFEREIQAFV